MRGHRHGGERVGGPSAAAAGRAGIATQKLRGGGAHQQEQDGLLGLACALPPALGQRTRHRQGGGGGGGPSAAAAGRASIEEHKLRGVGAHQQEQNYQGWPARTPPCAGSARGTDRAGEEEGGHPPRRQAGQASPCSTCERLRRFSQSSTGLACVRHAVHRLVRRAAGVKKVGSAPCRSAGEGLCR